MKSWAISVLAAVLSGCRVPSDSRPAPAVTPPLPTHGSEASPCPPGSPLVSELQLTSSVGAAPSIGAPAVGDVLRRAFPAVLLGATPDYVEGFAHAMLSVPAAVAPDVSPFDAAVWRAECTARSLSGLHAPFRGQA
jgi:hypothetical protein